MQRYGAPIDDRLDLTSMGVLSLEGRKRAFMLDALRREEVLLAAKRFYDGRAPEVKTEPRAGSV